MKTAWNTLRVKVTALLVGAILLVVGLATAISFYVIVPISFRPVFDRESAQVIMMIRLAEAAPDLPELKPYIQHAQPTGMVLDMPTRGLGDSLARAGVKKPVVVVDNGEGRQPSAAVELVTGRWLVLPTGMPPPPPGRYWELSFWMCLIALGTTAVTSLAIRRLTRPLTMIEEALDSVSGTYELPHLEERGTTEVRAAARTINRLSDQLRTALETRMRIVAAAAHDLRTPMTRMRLRAEFIEDDEERGKWLHDLEEVDRIADSAIRLVREEVRPDLKVELALHALAREVIEDLASMSLPAETGRMEVVRVQGHPLALKRAVRNLAINAATHGKKARLSVFVEGGAAVLEVKDEGPGIPEHLLPRVFEPFFRIDPARQPSGPAAGAGLGMAIAKEIVERQGGSLAIFNGTVRGLVQVIRLPLAEPRTPAPE